MQNIQIHIPDTAYADFNLNSLPQISSAAATTPMKYCKFCGQQNPVPYLTLLLEMEYI